MGTDAGMGNEMGIVVDERGRVTLPQDIREAAGLTPGREVRIERTPDGVLLRPALSKEEIVAKLEGAADSSKVPGKRIDPLRLKEIWGAFHDHD